MKYIIDIPEHLIEKLLAGDKHHKPWIPVKAMKRMLEVGFRQATYTSWDETELITVEELQ